MASKVAVTALVSALVFSGVHEAIASPHIQTFSFEKTQDVVLSPGGIDTLINTPPSQISASSHYANILAEATFDPQKWKTTFDRDPNFLAWATRDTAFWRFLAENDLIGMPREKVIEFLGPGKKIEDASIPAAQSATADENNRPGYLLTTKITGAKIIATCFQLEYKDDKVSQWRMLTSENHYPVSSPDQVFRMDLVSPWVNQNVVESDMCDFGLKIKKNLLYVDREKVRESVEDSRPPFAVASEKKLPTTEEPIAFIMLPPQPTSADYLNAAILSQSAVLLKAARMYTEKAIATAKTDFDRKKARSFFESRLPRQTPPWAIQKRYMESYAASKRKEADNTATSGYEKNIRDCPNFEYTYYTLGMIRREEQNYAGAKLLFEKAIEINPKYQKAIFGLAAIKMQANNASEAKKMALQAYFLYPYDAWAKQIYHSIANEDAPKEEPAGLYPGAKSKAPARAAKKH